MPCVSVARTAGSPVARTERDRGFWPVSWSAHDVDVAAGCDRRLRRGGSVEDTRPNQLLEGRNAKASIGGAHRQDDSASRHPTSMREVHGEGTVVAAGSATVCMNANCAPKIMVLLVRPASEILPLTPRGSEVLRIDELDVACPPTPPESMTSVRSPSEAPYTSPTNRPALSDDHQVEVQPSGSMVVPAARATSCHWGWTAPSCPERATAAAAGSARFPRWRAGRGLPVSRRGRTWAARSD